MSSGASKSMHKSRDRPAGKVLRKSFDKTMPIKLIATKRCMNSVTDPVSDPVTDPVTDPVSDPVTDPVSDPVTYPVTWTGLRDSVNYSVTEPTTVVAKEAPPKPPITCSISISRGNGKDSIVSMDWVELQDTDNRNVALQRLAARLDKTFTKQFLLVKKKEEEALQQILLRDETRKVEEALQLNYAACNPRRPKTSSLEELRLTINDIQDEIRLNGSAFLILNEFFKTKMQIMDSTLYELQADVKTIMRSMGS